MTNDQVWHQSTVMERCEILKSRLDLIDESLAVEPTYLPGAEIKPTPGVGYELINRDEYARLRRIEEAASRTVVHVDMNLATLDISPALRDLREALKR